MDERLDPLDLGLLPFVGLARELEPRLPLLEVPAVGHRVVGHAAVQDLGDVVDRNVEEVAVVRHHDDRARVGGEELLEPVARLEVEVIGGLVERQDVGAAEEQLRERDAHLPSARELGAVAVEVVRPEAEAAEDGLRLRLRVVPAVVVPLLAHRRVAFHDARVLPARGIDGGERLFDGSAPCFERMQLGERRERVGADRHPADEHVLRQVPDGGTARQRDGARVGLEIARDDAEERRLAGAVRAREPDARAVGHAPRDVGEDDLPAVPLGDAGEVQHANR